MNLYFDTVYEQIAEMAAGDLPLCIFSKHLVSRISFWGLRRQRKQSSESRYPKERGLKWGGCLYTFFHLDGPYSQSSGEFCNMLGGYFVDLAKTKGYMP